ncbi:DUF4233 domain-containing protein [Kineococcus rhizosphaerae]|uniref:Uncharacterized protein DUF4233 n=1 Tax=Kineococcus rhizosphaerae TaxID=559628 RepID=A0A2T0R7I1_9ACTN|nr:DUF4233 domain-containing protein [Kineococcus rhizosphaerae]PRY17126.1 uncharacterized protein DUF4233 [Kineococcus rhizosphaerae]
MSREPRVRRPRQRSTKRLFAATTLACEALLVFFATLVAYGIEPMAERHTSYLVAGGVLILLCLLAAGMLRSPAGYWFGWVLQLVIVASGFVVPIMFVIGVAFAVIWFFALRIGGRVDREKAEVARRLADGT